MNCSNPIDAAVLADYWLALLADPAEEVVEEHLLGCDECGARLGEVIALADAIHKLAREGSLRMVVSDTFLKRVAEEGLRVREYAPSPGGGVQCTVTEEDDFLIGRLAANLGGAKRVDLSLCDGRGIEATPAARHTRSFGVGQRYLPGVDHICEGNADNENDCAIDRL